MVVCWREVYETEGSVHETGRRIKEISGGLGMRLGKAAESCCRTSVKRLSEGR